MRPLCVAAVLEQQRGLYFRHVTRFRFLSLVGRALKHIIGHDPRHLTCDNAPTVGSIMAGGPCPLFGRFDRFCLSEPHRNSSSFVHWHRDRVIAQELATLRRGSRSWRRGRRCSRCGLVNNRDDAPNPRIATLHCAIVRAPDSQRRERPAPWH